MIVEFLEERDFMIAWVLSPATHRLGVLTMGGREMTIAQTRVLNRLELSDPGSWLDRLELLRAAGVARQVLASQIDLVELWTVLEGEGTKFSFEVLATLFFGQTAGVDEISAMARAVFADGLWFRFTPGGAVRHTDSEVVGLREVRHRAAEAENTLVAMAGWLVGLKKGDFVPEPPEAGRTRELLLDLALWGEEAALKSEAKKILERASFPPDAGGAAMALVLTGDFSRHENLELRRLNFSFKFSSEVLSEAGRFLSGSSLGTTRGGGDSRQDLTGLTTLSIDSNGAREIDDAISIKSLAENRWQVGIHITDVAAVIEADSILDLAGRARATSVYLPDAKYSMFPAELSEGLLSLTLGDVKPAFSFLLTLEKDGSISDYSLVLSSIRVDRQLSFSEADQYLEEDSDLVELWDMAQVLLARRLSQGGCSLNIPKLNIYFLPDGSLSVGLTQWDTPAKIIVAELMILANFLAADLLYKNDYPCPYRFQEKPGRPISEELVTIMTNRRSLNDQQLALSLASRRHTGRGGLSFVPSPHQGLGFPVYTAFTAPMRRYLDLLVARQLRSLIKDQPPAMDQQTFMRLALPVHEFTQRIHKMQTSRQRYWLKQYLKDKIGREYSALVFEQRGRRLRACLTDYMLEIELNLFKEAGGNPPELSGQRLVVKLVEVPPGDIPPRFEVF
ncbi:MAG: RNB domain-containing ribonuclease [Candidatus Adiutrix intracellularis]|jgi:exoribonuclease-2|nr:RNB domain-containing ribonuclease [Candidatus Adiutrix intracellularis]